MAIVAFIIIAVAIALAMTVFGGYGRLSRALKKRRERRRRAAEDDESVTNIEVQVRGAPGGNGGDDVGGRLSGETVVVPARRA